MKHLIKYNELKSSTYLSASKKLKDLKHVNRSKNLEEWGGRAEADEKRVAEQEQRVKWANSGVYDLSIFDSRWLAGSAGKSGKWEENDIMTGRFHISLDYERDMFSDQYWDWSDGNYDHKLFIAFTMGILPADDETSLEFRSNEEIKSNLWGPGLWPQWLYICVADAGEVNLNVSANVHSMDQVDSLKFRFLDRASALKFKRFLVSELSGQTNNTNIKDRIEKHIALIKTDDTYKKNIPDDFMSRLVKSANAISLNKLYR